MSDEFKELKEDILAEQGEIEEAIRRLLLIRNDQLKSHNDYVSIPAIGTYLMNFYNGVENILKRICKVYYQSPILKSSGWHKELLDSAYQPPQGKYPIFSRPVVERYQYKNFRHRFISGYGYQLKIEKMVELINNLDSLWVEIKNELNVFLGKL